MTNFIIETETYCRQTIDPTLGVTDKKLRDEFFLRNAKRDLPSALEKLRVAMSALQEIRDDLLQENSLLMHTRLAFKANLTLAKIAEK